MLQSPGIDVREYDLSEIIINAASTTGALGGVFAWGPINTATLVASEADVVKYFGPCTNSNFETFLTGASFLAYSNALYISRAANGAHNALAGPSYTNVSVSNTVIQNVHSYEALTAGGPLANGNAYYAAKWAGIRGNSLRIAVCENANQYSSVLTGNSTVNATFSFTIGANQATLTVTGPDPVSANTMANTILASLTIGDYLEAGNSTLGQQPMQLTAMSTTTVNVSSNTATATLHFDDYMYLASNVSQTSVTRFWEFAAATNKAPGTSTYTALQGGSGDQLHVVVVDELGDFTGVAGEVLEIFPNLSRAIDGENLDGGPSYYKTVLNQQSAYVWFGTDRPGSPSNTAVNMTPTSNPTPLNLTFYGGTDSQDESTIDLASLTNAYLAYKNKEDITVDLVMAGKARGGIDGEQLANFILDNIVGYRKDCVAFISPNITDVVNVYYAPEQNVVNFKNLLRDSSYYMMDSGYKYMYDAYNNLYRWVPLNGDIAGLCAYTDNIRDPWWSPAGFNRGILKNVIKLAFNPNQTQRDVLYSADVNPVVTFKNHGTVLYGDKTGQHETGAFSRINVRRLFIVMERAISAAAQYLLFEFNDSFTQAMFRNMVNPYLANIQGLRGIYAYKVICDGTNNTPLVVDSNQFVGTIMVQPAKSINTITLNFLATPTGIDFSTIQNSFGA